MKLNLDKCILLTCLLIGLPAYGQEVEMGAVPLKFKLGVTMEEKPLFADQREIKPMPSVDSVLINQILNVRQDLPSWQGVHHLVPGASSGP